MPMRARPRIVLASLFSRTRPTLGREAISNSPHGGCQPPAHEAVEAARHRGSEQRCGRRVLDPEDDPGATGGDPGECEAAPLLDQPGLGNPADLVGPSPPIQPEHAAQRESERGHLDRVARADALRLRTDGVPAANAFEHLRDVAVVGEIVEGLLRRGADGDRYRQLELGQYVED